MPLKKSKKTKKKSVTRRQLADTKPNPLADVEVLAEALGGDLELVLFFMTWVSCGRNSTKAYLKLHPEVTPKSASVLGARQLAKVSIPVILDAYGLGVDTYLNQLKEGLNATKRVDVAIIQDGEVVKGAEEVPDHKVRQHYHQTLGKLLSFEKPEVPNVKIQFNALINQKKKEYGF